MSPFYIIDTLRKEIHLSYQDITKGDYASIKSKIPLIGQFIQQICLNSTDPAIASIWLKQYDLSYAADHAVNCAIISEIMTRELGYDETERLLLIKAALTMNIGMIELQNELFFNQSELTLPQKQLIKQHPKKAITILKQCGITDKSWLETVAYHHERCDGKGYPSRLSKFEIPETARILTFIDTYAALVSPRNYRPGMACDKVIKQTLPKRDDIIDVSIIPAFEKTIGTYPPGITLVLKDQTSAIIIEKATRNKPTQIVKIIAGETKQPETLESLNDIIKVEKLNYQSQTSLRSAWNYNEPVQYFATDDYDPQQREIDLTICALQKCQFPEIPRIIFDILQESQTDSPQVQKIVEWITSDTDLSDIVIQTVNTSLYGIETKISSVQHGMMIMGLKTLKNLVLGSVVLRIAQSGNDQLINFWKKASLNALCATRIAKAAKTETYLDPDIAYLAGLFHDSGTLFLAEQLEQFDDKKVSAHEHPFDIIDIENEHFGTNHTIVGWILAKYWHVPENVCQAIYQQRIKSLGDITNNQIQSISAIIALTHYIVNYTLHIQGNDRAADRLVEPGESIPQKLYREQPIAILKISYGEIKKIQQEVREQAVKDQLV